MDLLNGEQSDSVYLHRGSGGGGDNLQQVAEEKIRKFQALYKHHEKLGFDRGQALKAARQEISALKQEVSRRKEELEQLRAEVEIVRKERDKLSLRCEQERSGRNQASRTANELKKKNEELHADVARLQQQLRDKHQLECEIAQVKSKLDKRRDSVRQTQMQLSAERCGRDSPNLDTEDEEVAFDQEQSCSATGHQNDSSFVPDSPVQQSRSSMLTPPPSTDAFNLVSLRDLSEIKALKTPPEPIRLLMEVVCLLLGIPPKKKIENGRSVSDYWEPARKQVLSNPNVQMKLRQVNEGSQLVDSRVLNTIHDDYLQNPNFSEEKVANCCARATGLYRFVQEIVERSFIDQDSEFI